MTLDIEVKANREWERTIEERERVRERGRKTERENGHPRADAIKVKMKEKRSLLSFKTSEKF